MYNNYVNECKVGTSRGLNRKQKLVSTNYLLSLSSSILVTIGTDLGRGQQENGKSCMLK